MENEKAMDEKVKDFKPEQDLTLFFENFIKTGEVIKEKEIVPGMTIKLKVLDTGEMLAAESVLSLTAPGVPLDVIQKVRGASILSQAIISINGNNIEKEALDKKENRIARDQLYTNLLRLPGIVVQKAYELYLEAYAEQTKVYAPEFKLAEKIENF